MPDLLSPVVIVEQRELFQQQLTDAEKAADEAQKAADEARRTAEAANEAAEIAQSLNEKRKVLLDILQLAHIAIRQKYQSTYSGAKTAFLIPYSTVVQSLATQTVVCWPLNESGEYILAYTPRRETCIGKTTHEGKFAEMSLEEIVSLDVPVLHEMRDHLQDMVTDKVAPATRDLWPAQTTDDLERQAGEIFEASTEPDYSHQNNLQPQLVTVSADVSDSSEQYSADPDIYTADTSAHVGVPDHIDTNASWHQGTHGQ